MSSAFDCPPIFFPDTVNCSGRGVCSFGACVCNPGWTGHGDFVLGSPTCGINIAAIQALWALLGIIHLVIVQPSTIRFLWMKYKQPSSIKSSVYMGVFIFISSACFLITAWNRVAHPVTGTIGTNPVSTVFFAFGVGTFWTATHFFAYAFIDLSMKQARLSRNHDEANQRMFFQMKIQFFISACVAFVAGLLPIGMLGTDSFKVVQNLATSHYLISALEVALAGLFIVPHFIKIIITEIKDAIATRPPGKDDGRLSYVLWRLQRFLKELRNQAIINVIFACLFGFWPFLLINGSSYFLPFAWTSACVTEILAFHVSSPVKEGKTSSSTGGGGEVTISNPAGPSQAVAVQSVKENSYAQGSVSMNN